MGIWIEIHCDVHADGPPDPKRISPFCWSNDASIPGAMTANPRERIIRGLRRLERQAKRAGWVKRRGMWVCPNCKTV